MTRSARAWPSTRRRVSILPLFAQFAVDFRASMAQARSARVRRLLDVALISAHRMAAFWHRRGWPLVAANRLIAHRPSKRGGRPSRSSLTPPCGTTAVGSSGTTHRTCARLLDENAIGHAVSSSESRACGAAPIRRPVHPFPPVDTVAAPCGSPAVLHLHRYYGLVRLLACPCLRLRLPLATGSPR